MSEHPEFHLYLYEVPNAYPFVHSYEKVEQKISRHEHVHTTQLCFCDLWWKDIPMHLKFVHCGYKTFYEPGELFWGRVKLDDYKDYGPTYEETTKWSAYMAFDRSKDKTNYQNPELAIHKTCLEKDRL